MLSFKTPELSDIEWATKIIEGSDVLSADSSFTNNFLWRKKYNIKICEYNGSLLKTFGINKSESYAFPIGSENPKDAIKAMQADAYERGIDFVIGGITEGKKEYLQAEFKGEFEFFESRDDADYVYLQENLANLAGKKYQKKRNHISKFLRTYEDVKFVPLNSQTYADALKVARLWCNEHGCIDSGDGLGAEYCAIKEAFDNFEALNLSGGVLYVSGEPAAMTAGAKINANVFDICFEKALDFDGAYPMINREFAKTLGNFTFINREEDMGIEGLRKAKLSYYPETILMKYRAKAVK